MTADTPNRASRGAASYLFDRWWQETGEFELRQILHWKWDPLGIEGRFPLSIDTYDGCAECIADVLKGRFDEIDVAERLLAIEHDQMGLPVSAASAEARRAVAAAIVQWHANSWTRWRELGRYRRQ